MTSLETVVTGIAHMAAEVANAVVLESLLVFAAPVLLGAAIGWALVTLLVAFQAEVPDMLASVLDVRLHSVRVWTLLILVLERATHCECLEHTYVVNAVWCKIFEE